MHLHIFGKKNIGHDGKHFRRTSDKLALTIVYLYHTLSVFITTVYNQI